MTYKFTIAAGVSTLVFAGVLIHADNKLTADRLAFEQRFHDAPAEIVSVTSMHDELTRRGFDEHSALYGVALRDLTCRNIDEVVNPAHQTIVKTLCDNNSAVSQFPMHKGQYKVANLYAKDFPRSE